MNENGIVDYRTILPEGAEFMPDDCVATMQAVFRQRTIKKDMFFLQAGEKPTEIGLVVNGLFRSFYVDKKGNDITKYFQPEGSVLFSYAAHLAKKESAYFIQALEESRILAAPISDFEKMLETNDPVSRLFSKILNEVFVMKEEHACSFKLLNSTERYEKFLLQYPGLEERIKQYQLASYLGITPVSLSRIRNRLHLNK